MNRYTLADLEVGLTASFTREITEPSMDAFREMTGDENPMHCDDAVARARGFEGRVVYGMVTASLFSTLIGMYLPGEHALFHGLDLDFVKPVYVGDTLTVEGKIAEVDERFSRIEVQGTIRNQDGVKVCRAKLRAGVADVDS